MSFITRRWFILAATVLVIASAAALALLLPDEAMPGTGNPFSVFVQPGVTIWWLVLAEPSNYAPDSPTGFVFATAANGAFWLLVLWLVVAVVHSSVMRWWFVLAAAPVLVIASAAVLALLASTEVIPSAVENLLYWFVSPGAFVWWLTQGSLFGAAAPSSPTGIAFAAAINGAFWLLVLWLVVAVARAVRRMFSAPPS